MNLKSDLNALAAVEFCFGKRIFFTKGTYKRRYIKHENFFLNGNKSPLGENINI